MKREKPVWRGGQAGFSRRKERRDKSTIYIADGVPKSNKHTLTHINSDISIITDYFPLVFQVIPFNFLYVALTFRTNFLFPPQ